MARPVIRLAPQNFAEAETLTQVYGQYLKAKGFSITIQKPDGFHDQVYPDLQANKVDMIVDYTGSASSSSTRRSPARPDPAVTAATLATELASRASSR